MEYGQTLLIMQYLGINTFSNKVNYFTLFLDKDKFIKILAFIVPLQIAIMFGIYLFSFIKKSLEEKEWFKNITLLLIYSIITIVVIVPIADKNHFAIGSMCSIIAFIYLIYVILSKMTKNDIKIKKIISIYFKIVAKLLLGVAMCYSIYLFIGYTKNPDIRTDIKHFKNIPIEDFLYNRTVEIGSFIEDRKTEGKTVYILELSSAIYTIPIDEYNKNYDMFNLGNFGGKGTDGIIEDIENTPNLVLLVKKREYAMNWQHPKIVTDYVEERFEKVGEISIFNIYEK